MDSVRRPKAAYVQVESKASGVATYHALARELCLSSAGNAECLPGFRWSAPPLQQERVDQPTSHCLNHAYCEWRRVQMVLQPILRLPWSCGHELLQMPNAAQLNARAHGTCSNRGSAPSVHMLSAACVAVASKACGATAYLALAVELWR